jgi:hypothetical protein
MVTDTLQVYFKQQQVTLQWLAVLRAMAQEMSAQVDAKVLRQLFFKIGYRFAKDTDSILERVETLDQLEEIINNFWAQINWGWVSFNESDDCIEIRHSACPIGQAFGECSINWSIGLIEGFYQAVFEKLGAGENMLVYSIDKLSNEFELHLRFGLQVN